MMKMLKYFSIWIFLILAVQPVSAQTAGDYRTAGSGQWNNLAKWQKYSGTAWVAATSLPTGAETITIMPGDSLEVNTSITVTGKIINNGGKLSLSATTLTFGNGGVYNHAVDGGQIPLANWETGSTCLLTGIVSAAPSQSSQNFYNFSWNCPSYGSSAINLGWGGNTIKGDFRIIKGVATKTQVRLTASNIGNAAPGPNVITINGNIFIDDYLGVLTSSGSSGSDTIAVYVKGNISSLGTLNLCNGSGGQCNWYVGGNVNILGGSLATHSSAGILADTMIFVGTGTQVFYKADSVSSAANVQFAIRSGSTVDFKGSIIGGTITSLKAEDGAAMITAHVKGLKGLGLGGTVALGPLCSYEYNGSAAQVDSLMPASVKNLTINNPTTVEFIRPVTVNGVLTLKAGVLKNDVYAVTLGTGGSVVRLGGTTTVPIPGVGVKELKPAEKTFEVSQNYPNPFNPETRFNFSVPVEGRVVVKVYNIAGQEIATLFDGNVEAGKLMQCAFNGAGLSSGLYFVKVRQLNNSALIKMTLVK